MIVFSALHDCFSEVWFLVKAPSIESGHSAAYTGNFLHDIRTSDVRSEVQREMQANPVRSGLSRGSRWSADCNVDVYEVDHLEVKFSFDSRTDEMRAVSVKLRDVENRQEAINKFLSEHPEFKPHLEI